MSAKDPERSLRRWRGVALFLAGALAAGLFAVSPVGAAFTPTKAKIKKIATKAAKAIVNPLAGRLAVVSDDVAFTGTNNAAGTVLTTSITAPGPGYLVIAGSTNVTHPSGPIDHPNLVIEVDGAQVPNSTRGTDIGGVDTEPITSTVAVPVGGGDHAVDLEAQAVGTTIDATSLTQAFLWAFYVPLGATG